MKPEKVYVVLFFDGNGHVAGVRTISWDYLGKTVDEWAKAELASQRAPFPELIARGGRSVPETFVVYGSDVEAIP